MSQLNLFPIHSKTRYLNKHAADTNVHKWKSNATNYSRFNRTEKPLTSKKANPNGEFGSFYNLGLT